MTAPRATAVLERWLGPLDEQGMTSPEATARWWSKDPELDRSLRDQFAGDHARAVAGELDGWLEDPRGRLAYVIVIDQFSRNMFRGEAGMFAHDPLALAAALDGIDLGVDRSLRFAERVFLYMPLMHSERRSIQHLSVRLFERLAAEVPEPAQKSARANLDFAVRHFEIVERFGRFPHRNAVLGRTSSQEERDFLAQPGSSF